MGVEFNDRAQRIIDLAEERARKYNHDYVGTEHILLGMLDAGEGIATKALESLGLSLDVIRQALRETLIQGSLPPSGRIPFTREAARVLELSRQEAANLGLRSAGTEHILVGLLEGGGAAARLLQELGVSVLLVRRQVSQLRDGLQGGEPVGLTSGGAASGRARPPVLEAFASDLTRQAREGTLYPAVGRDQEIGDVMQALSSGSGNCLIVIGEITGRTAVLEGLAQRIASGEAPQKLRGRQLYYCHFRGIGTATVEQEDVEADLRDCVIGLLATPVRTLPENLDDHGRRRIGASEVLAAILQETQSRDDIIIAVDLLPGWAAKALWKPMLTSSARRIIGLASPSDYREFSERDGAFIRGIPLVHVGEQTTAYAIGKLNIALRATAEGSRPAR